MELWQLDRIDFNNYKYVKFSKELQKKVDDLLDSLRRKSNKRNI